MSLLSAKKSLRRGFTLIEIMIVVLIIGILLAIAVPNFVKARESARTKSCVSNMQQIQSAKQQWAMDGKKAGTDSPTTTDLYGTGKYISGAGPQCPSGNVAYVLGTVDTDQVCPNVATNATTNSTNRSVSNVPLWESPCGTC